MKNNGMITITMSEYTRLLRADITLDILTNRAKTERYFSGSEVRAVLGIPEKEEDE